MGGLTLYMRLRVRGGWLRSRGRCVAAGRGQSGSVSLELVLLVPVLVLLAVFVLWAGRGGRAGLTADLAAEEAATAAAVCCEEDSAGEPGRAAIVEDVLRSRPGLGFLCMGGLQPVDRGDGEGPLFVDEHWLAFDPAASSDGAPLTGGVGLLDVRFVCETDGAVAPLRGLFPTVTFHGQASEVVLREPPESSFSVGFERATFSAVEGGTLVFRVVTGVAVAEDTTVQWAVVPDKTTADQDADFTPEVESTDEVTIRAGEMSAEFEFFPVGDGLYEGNEVLELGLVPGSVMPAGITVDAGRRFATGTVEDFDPAPYLWIFPKGTGSVFEGGTLEFVVRLRDARNTRSAPSMEPVTVEVSTVDVDAVGGGGPCEGQASPDYLQQTWMLTFGSGEVEKTVTVTTCNDFEAPLGEPTETFELTLSNAMRDGVAVGVGVREATGTILDNEARVSSVEPLRAYEGDEGDVTVRVEVALDQASDGDVGLHYRIQNNADGFTPAAVGGTVCAIGVDYVTSEGTLTFLSGSRFPQAFDLELCPDTELEPDETLWIALERVSGEVYVPAGEGERFTIRNDDGLVIWADETSGTEAPADGTLTFTVNLINDGEAAVMSERVTVGYALEQDSPVSARECDDYRRAGVSDADCRSGVPTVSQMAGTLSFAAGTAMPQTVEVELVADYEREDDETFRLRLFDGDTSDIATLEEVFAVGTIFDDPPPVLTVGDFEGREGTEQRFAVSLVGARRGETVTVDYAVAGHGDPPGAARPPGSPADFEMVSQTDRDGTQIRNLFNGTLTLDADNPAAAVAVELLSDTVKEAVEQLRLLLSNPSHAVRFDRDHLNDADRDGDPANDAEEAYGVGTILDVDAPQICALDTSAEEGGTMAFTVVVINPLDGETVEVDYEVEPRSAKPGRDYTEPSSPRGRLAFTADDGADLTDGMRNACNPPADASDTVLAKTVPAAPIQILTDKIPESPETLHLALSNPSAGVGFAKAVGVGTIVNINAAVVRVNNPEAPEGDRDRPLKFVISLVDDHGNPVDRITADVTVGWSTDDRTATAGADYNAIVTAETNRHTFKPSHVANGDTTHTVEVQTLADNENEDDETMALLLYIADTDRNPDNDAASLGDAEGTGTIIDAPPPVLRIGDAEGDEGETLTFYVRLGVRDGGTFVDKATDEVVRVHATTEELTAESPEDYTHKSQELVFGVGDTVKPFTVATVLDTVGESRERFHVVLSGANVNYDRAYGIGTIKPQCRDLADSVPTLTLQDAAGYEGAVVRPNFSFSHPICGTFDMDYRYRFDGTAVGADINDVVPNPFSRVRGLSGASYTVPPPSNVVGGASLRRDGLDEDDETFTVEARIVDQPWSSATITIRDNDPLPRATIAEASAPEGRDLEFVVSLNTASGRAVALEYITVDTGGAGSADPGTDYVPVSAWRSLTIPEGGTTVTIPVATIDDGDDSEGDETLQVWLRADQDAANVTVADSVAVGTILAADRPRLSIADARAAETDDNLVFDVTLSEAAASPVTVAYETVQQDAGPGRATADDDYTAAAAGASVTIGAGARATTIRVPVIDDEEPEGDETFLVNITGPTGVGLLDASALGTIEDDDVSCVDPNALEEPLLFTVSEPRVPESASVMDFIVELPQALCHSYHFVVNQNVPSHRRGTATAGEDYEFAAHYNFDFPPFLTQSAVRVNLLADDDLDEPDETIVLRFQAFAAPYRRIVFAEGTIVDNDGEPEVSVAAASAAEGERLGFVVRLDRPSGRDVEVDYATADRGNGTVVRYRDPRRGWVTYVSAGAGADYRAVSDTVTIPAGELSASVVVDTVEDGLDEATERFEFRLSSPDGATLAAGGEVALGSIIDDDDPPAVRILDAAADEDDPLEFVVRLDGPSGRETSVAYATRQATRGAAATEGTDYTRTSGRLVFAAGETRKTVSVRSLSDAVEEGDEIFFVDLSGWSHLADGDRTGAGTIRDLTVRRLTVADAFVREGGSLVFRVGFDGPPASRDVTVRYRTAAGTAAAVDDYSDAAESAPRPLRILAGASTAAIWIPTVQDRLDEDAERLTLTLSDPEGAVLADGEAVGVIIDDDPLPRLSVDDPEAAENGDGDPITFTVSLSEPSGRDVSASYATADLTAVAGDDYTASEDDASVAIAAGHTAAKVEVALVNDDDPEDPERFQLVLSNRNNADFGDSVGVGTIIDDDGPPQLLVDGPAPVREADGAAAVFGVRLSRPAAAAVTVDYATADGTATAGDDYTAVTTTRLIFAVGETAKEVSVTVLDDDDVEDTETFDLALSNASSNAEIAEGEGTATAAILDDDSEPKLSVADATGAEGAAAVFEISLDKASSRAVSFSYAAVADPTAAAGAAAVPALDFEAVAGTGIITAGTTATTVRVPLPDDALDENTETFWLRITDPDGAAVADGTATGSIADNDPLPRLSIADSSAEEGDPVGFTVTLAPASGRTVSVPWTTLAQSEGDNRAAAGEDFTAASGTLTFTPGTTAAPVSVDTVEDDLAEADETFLLQLGEPVNAITADSAAVGVIRDDDGLPRASIADIEVSEDDSPAVFTVRLTRTSTETVSLDYYTTDGTATAGADYATASGARGTLVIPAGLDIGEISVYIADDNLIEGAETFTITLHNASNAVVAEGEGTATATILDDDITRVSIAGAQASEGDGTIDFDIAATPAPTTATTVRYATFDGTATQPGDYTATTGTLRIPAGRTTASVSVPLTDDIYHEETETLLVRLSDPGTGAEIDRRDHTAIGVILDDDDLPQIITDNYLEFDEDEGTVDIQVTLSKPSDREIRVDYSAGDHRPVEAWQTNPPGRNGCEAPYRLEPGTLVIPPGSVAATIPITLVNDGIQCHYNTNRPLARTFRLYLRNAVNAAFYSDYGYQSTSRDIRISVWDVAVQPCVAIQGPGGPQREGAVREDEGAAVFRVLLHRVGGTNVVVTVRTRNASPRSWEPQGRATAGTDYTALNNQRVPVTADSTEALVRVPLINDNISEPVEGFALAYVSATNSSGWCSWWSNRFAHAFIFDDDTLPEITVTDVDVSESAGNATFNVTLDRASSSDVTVRYATANGTASAPGDYTAATGTLTLEAGATGGAVEVPVVDDDEEEEDETFTLRLYSPSGATISGSEATATATIRDDDGDSLPVLSIADAVVAEKDNSVQLTVTLNQPAPGSPCINNGQVVDARWCGRRGIPQPDDWVSVSYTTVALPPGPNTATPTSLGGLSLGDYRPKTGTLAFRPGDTEATFTVGLTQRDRLPEFDEKFLVVLYDPAYATLGDSRAEVTITDNDLPLVTVADVSASEGAGEVTFTVQLHAPGVYNSSVRYRTVVHARGDAPATPDEDYVETSGKLDIRAGTESVTVTVPVADDGTDEPDESFILELYEPKVLTLEIASAVGTITDDDPGYWIEDDRTVWEDAGTMVFTVTRDHTSDESVTVDYTVTAVSATAGTICVDGNGVDYIAPSGSLTLAPAATSGTITITVCDDDEAAEGRETLLVELTGVPGRNLSATGTIIDDD